MKHRIKYELNFQAVAGLAAMIVKECNKQADFCNKLTGLLCLGIHYGRLLQGLELAVYCLGFEG